MNQLQLTEIWIYPIKSMGGISLKSSEILPKGLKHDRRFVLADNNGIALTQREIPQLALCRTSIEAGHIVVNYQGETISVPLTHPSGNISTLRIFDDEVQAYEVDHAISKWFSSRLKTDCKLFFFPEEHPRPVDAKYQVNSDHVSLADAFPFLIIGLNSLGDLNDRLESPLPMNRFRPNFIFKGGTPYEEDTWKEFFIGDAKFMAVKPCARCIITTTDQNSGQRSPEPLKTLAKYRSQNNKVLFGQNVLHLSGTQIQVGDEISVRSYR